MAEYRNKIGRKYLDNSGIGLVEVLIALALGTMLIVSLFTLTNFNIRNSLLVSRNQEAINSTNQLLENIRTIKDVDFINSFAAPSLLICPSSGGPECIVSNRKIVQATVVSPTDSNPVISTFKVARKVSTSSNDIEVYIMTEWKVGNSFFSAPLTTVFTNWRLN